MRVLKDYDNQPFRVVCSLGEYIVEGPGMYCEGFGDDDGLAEEHASILNRVYKLGQDSMTADKS